MDDQFLLHQFDRLHAQLDDFRKEGSERGRRMWEQIDALRRDVAVVSHRLDRIEASDAGQSETIGKYRRLEHQAEGAGWLGRKLLAIGAVLLSGAVWVYSARDAILDFLARNLSR